MIDFSPNDVTIRTRLPFTGLFERLENEIAVACIVAACQDHRDWFAASAIEVRDALERRGDLGWTRLPAIIVTPNFARLVEKGWARWQANHPDDPRRIELTITALERIGKSAFVVRPGGAG